MTGYAKTAAKVDESVDEYNKSREAKVDEYVQHAQLIPDQDTQGFTRKGGRGDG